MQNIKNGKCRSGDKLICLKVTISQYVEAGSLIVLVLALPVLGAVTEGPSAERLGFEVSDVTLRGYISPRQPICHSAGGNCRTCCSYTYD